MDHGKPTATALDGDAANTAVISASELIEINHANEQGLFPKRSGRKICRGVLWRMHAAGSKTASGEIVKLRVVREGRTVYVTKKWVDDYFAALATPPSPATKREQRRRSYANTHTTPQMRPDAAAALRRHGLAKAAGLDP